MEQEISARSENSVAMATLRLWLAALTEFALERPIKSAIFTFTGALCVYAAIFDPYGGEDPNSCLLYTSPSPRDRG